MPKKIVILFSDAGGGHRSAGEAIAEALIARQGAEVQVEMVDALKHYAPFPFNRLPGWYPALIRWRWLWKLGYDVTDGPRRARLTSQAAWPLVRPAMRRLIREHPADLYVSVHWIYLTAILNALGKPRPPVITVVTDLVTIHAWWGHPGTDLCVVPTEPARQRLLHNGLPPDKVQVVGLPVASRFCAPAGDKAHLRARLGWTSGHPLIVVVGGGEGMGPLFEISQAIAASGLPCELAIVAGRNQALRARLEAAAWPVPAHIYGFVTEMPDFMRAADILVTKAGPGTISEAFNAGLPIILYDFLPGQEEGNKGYVVDTGAGLWAPGPEAVVHALRQWIGPAAGAQALAQAAQNAQKLARPDAAQRIAAEIWQRLAADR